MKALVFDGKILEEKNVRRPAAGIGEALVRIDLAGICSTDIEILRGYMDFRGIPGHEFVGTVVACESSHGLEGKRVTGEINLPCFDCSICASGLTRHCGKRKVLGISGKNGTFAEYITIPARNLHEVPDGLSGEEAAFTELLAAACEITESVKVSRTDRAAVLGAGRLGALAAKVLSLRTKHVTVIGRGRKKLDAIAAAGISTIEAGGLPPEGRCFDIVVECTGSPAGLPIAAGLVRPRGTIVLKSTYHGRLSWNPAPLVIDEIRVIGSRCGPFDRALDLLGRRKIDVKPFLTGVYPFESWKKAFSRARGKDSFKVLLSFPRQGAKKSL